MEEFVVRKTVRIKADPAEVWNALTNPTKTKEYFFNCEVYSDWEVGSTITFTGKLFYVKDIEMKGQILAIEPNKLLKYSLANEGDEDPTNFSIVTDELTFEDGETVLSISDNVGQGEGAQERYERSEKGWDKILKGLKELVEADN